MNKLLLYSLVVIHFIVILLLIITPPLVIIMEPFWVSIPICIWVMHLMFSPVLVCPATIWENRLRRKLEMPEIKTFFYHYFIVPICKFFMWIKRQYKK